MGFFIYDLSFLLVFIIFIIFFLNKNKKNLKREGFMYLYRAEWGIKAIKLIGDKYKKTLHVLKYFSIGIGYILMGSMIYLLWTNLYLYIKVPAISQLIKAPPIAPLIPYFPKLYGMESFFPPFYFTYFILALAVVAITHEFSHGIFMRLFNIKIKSTGFAFFGPFLGAFVEEDQKSFSKKTNIGQMSVLSAGAFANIITAIISFVIMVLFFYASFNEGGYKFNTYTYSILPLNETVITNQTMNNFSVLKYQSNDYYLDESLLNQLNENQSYIIAYDSQPAIKFGLKGIIIQINGNKIRNQEDLQEFMIKTSPEEEVNITTILNNEKVLYSFNLSTNKLNSSIGYLGIGYLESKSSSSITSWFVSIIQFKNPSIEYKARYNKDIAEFIYYLLWWTSLISFLVGLFNMLPLGILDGGRFFYLTILSLTKSKKVAENSFKVISGLILFVFLFLTFIWFKRLF